MSRLDAETIRITQYSLTKQWKLFSFLSLLEITSLRHIPYLPSKRMSFAIFISEAEIVLRAPLVSTKASCAAWKKSKSKHLNMTFQAKLIKK